MKILGLQKTTLIDYPGKVACTIFLFGCNFRCGFCHNPGLVLSPEGEEYSQEEILDFLKKRVGQLDAVCFTGGEPLMTLEKDFVKEIKSLGYFVKLDTNGGFPEQLQDFLKEGLIDFVAMDIKNSRKKYSELAGVDVNLKDIEKSMILISQLENYEFRTTIIEGKHSILDISELIDWVSRVINKRIKNYSLQGFKKEEKLINREYLIFADTRESYLEEIKREIENRVDNLEIKI